MRIIHEDGRSCNYLTAIFDTGDVRIAALCNRVHPYLGFVPVEMLPFGPEWPPFVPGAAFSNWAGFRLLDPAFLNAELRPDMLGALAPSELHQIGYWKPTKVGDVIFNFWD
jgi:hypothetical protein